MADIKPWMDWYQSFVIDGHNSDDQEIDGELIFMHPNNQHDLAAIEFHNVGIFALEPIASETNKDGISRFTVELYVERMSFKKL